MKYGLWDQDKQTATLYKIQRHCTVEIGESLVQRQVLRERGNSGKTAEPLGMCTRSLQESHCEVHTHQNTGTVILDFGISEKQQQNN